MNIRKNKLNKGLKQLETQRQLIADIQLCGGSFNNRSIVFRLIHRLFKKKSIKLNGHGYLYSSPKMISIQSEEKQILVTRSV